MPLALPNVTLVAIDGGPVADLLELAIRDCCAVADFGGMLRGEDLATPIDSVDAWNRAIWYDVPRLVSTSHYLVIQWDSWIVDPAAWSDEFLEYDYIGAPWWHPVRNVGNGGFSLRSKRLGLYLSDNRAALPPVTTPEDDLLCRRLRPLLRGELLFAPDDVAYRFARERTGWERPAPSFGFHGLWNFPRVLTMPQLAERLALFNDYVPSQVEYPQLLQMMLLRAQGRV
jgi:Protein of unknown function (DUF5672)